MPSRLPEKGSKSCRKDDRTVIIVQENRRNVKGKGCMADLSGDF